MDCSVLDTYLVVVQRAFTRAPRALLPPCSPALRFLLEKLTWENKTKYPLAATGKTLWCGLWAFLTFGKP